MTLDVQFAAPSAFVVEFGTDADLAADLGQTTILSTVPQYKGETTVTPAHLRGDPPGNQRQADAGRCDRAKDSPVRGLQRLRRRDPDYGR